MPLNVQVSPQYQGVVEPAGSPQHTTVNDLNENFASVSAIPSGFVGTARVGTDLYVGDGLSLVKLVKTLNANDIGTAGQQGFGVGVLSSLPSGFSKMTGTEDITSDNYGNYQYSDGSIMVWIPAFYYKYGTGANGLAINAVSIRAYSSFTDVTTANAAGDRKSVV